MNYTEQEIAEANEILSILKGMTFFKGLRDNLENYSSTKPKIIDTSNKEVIDYKNGVFVDESEPTGRNMIDLIKQTNEVELRENDEGLTEVIILERRKETDEERDKRIARETSIITRENKLIELAKAALNNRLIKDYFNLQDLLKL
jgi:hypothetical protein